MSRLTLSLLKTFDTIVDNILMKEQLEIKENANLLIVRYALQ